MRRISWIYDSVEIDRSRTQWLAVSQKWIYVFPNLDESFLVLQGFDVTRGQAYFILEQAPNFPWRRIIETWIPNPKKIYDRELHSDAKRTHLLR